MLGQIANERTQDLPILAETRIDLFVTIIICFALSRKSFIELFVLCSNGLESLDTIYDRHIDIKKQEWYWLDDSSILKLYAT